MSIVVLEGLRPWLVQRATAVVITAYLVFIVWVIGCGPEVSYQGWRSWVFDPVNSLFLGLFALSILFHAWIGMRDVILDYVRHTMLRFCILSMVMLTLIVSGLWILRILLIPAGGTP